MTTLPTATVPTTCARTGCQREAASVVGVAFYPPESVMRHYRSTRPLTRAILDLPVCEDCLATIRVEDLLLPQVLQEFTGLIERSSGTVVGRTAVVRVAFDDVEYLLMKRKGAAATIDPPAPPGRVQ